jgi:hypothetical protein
MASSSSFNGGATGTGERADCHAAPTAESLVELAFYSGSVLTLFNRRATLTKAEKSQRILSPNVANSARR